MLREQDIPLLIVVIVVVTIGMWVGERGCDGSAPLPKAHAQKMEQR